ncbi:MAG: beta-galactosidase, partial [Candidatus Aquilonibacter sp.]
MHLAIVLAAILWKTWHTSALTNDRGTPVFTVDGHPYFVYGAAFFYERTPVAQWRNDLLRYRAMGINTIDLYLIWNWHEPDAHTIDFDGHTNPQRNLRKLFALIHELGFKVIVRPGPVIRNEWRNGGYPDWLLEQPAYNMPLHDVLEGRYPATATLQNAHADAAADEWLHNPVHLRYAASWLHDVLTAIAPWSHDVIA